MQQLKRADITKEQLESWYIKELLSSKKIAKMIGVDKTVVIKMLKRFGIPIRTKTEIDRLQTSKEYYSSEKLLSLVSREQLNRWYSDDLKSLVWISKQIGIGKRTIPKILKLHSIPIERSFSKIDKLISKEKLEELYWGKFRTEKEIADMLGCCQQAVNKLRKKLGIKTKTPFESRINLETGRSKTFRQVKVNCYICGKEHFKRKRNLLLYKRPVCSKECQYKYQTTLVGPLSPQWRQIDLICAHCGKLYTDAPSQVNGKNNFCSRECHCLWNSINIRGENSPLWLGGHDDYYGASWDDARLAALERDGFKCVCCGRTRQEEGRELSVHHWVRFRYYKAIKEINSNYHILANNLNNLISLCNFRCHIRLEWETTRRANAVGILLFNDFELIERMEDFITVDLKNSVLDWTRKDIGLI